MKKNFARLVLLAAGAWSIRAVGPEASGLWALTTNLLAAVTIQAGLILSPWVLVVWALSVGLFWDVTTFSALGHHVLLIGGMGSLVCTQRGWWVGASAAEQMVGSILAAVTYFVADRVLHGLEVRQWSWPFTLSISLVMASFVNGLASVALGWCLETGARTAHVRMVGRGR